VNLSHHVWVQLRNISATELMRALERDQWSCDVGGGSIHIYLKDTRRVSVHFHPKKTFGEKLLKAMLSDIGWADEDAKRLKLAK
jgi:predicted RNA binding protein YcfA (HicA-like mRNA interferase family)